MCSPRARYLFKWKESLSMNKNSKRLGIYILLAMVFTVAAALLRTFALLGDLEDNLIYFKNGSLMLASAIVCAVGAVLLFTYCFTSRHVALRASFSSATTYIPTGLVATALVVLCAGLISFINAASPLPFAQSLVHPALMLAAVAALLTPFSAAHFFLTAFLTERHTTIRAAFSLATVLLLATLAAFLYFEDTTPLNSPNKLVDQMAYLFSALFFLYEARISLGREKWRPYSAFGLVAMLLCFYSAIPALIAYQVAGITLSVGVEIYVFTLLIGLFILARLCLTATLSEDGENRAMTGLREYAEARQASLTSNEHEVEDGEQITFEELMEFDKGDDIVEDDEAAPAELDTETDGESE